MKRFLLAFVGGCLLSVALLAQQLPINIIPQPVSVQAQPGVFRLTAATSIQYGQLPGQYAATALAEKLSKPTGFPLRATPGDKGAIQFTINATPNAAIGSEGYTLEVTPKRVIIAANQPAGLFYGMQSLLQLLPKEVEGQKTAKVAWTMPAVRVTDQPRFGWRGIMLDVSRHFFTKAEVKRYIDQLAALKYNTFHWHLTDDNGWRIEIKSLPKLTEVGAWRVERSGKFGQREFPKPGEPAKVGGFYTQDDIREIIRYAADRYVTIVPEIDVPGHSMAALAAYPELSCTKAQVFVNPGSQFSDWFGNGTFRMNVENTLNPSDENVYVFLDKVFTEVAALFPNQYIHVGGDECYKGYWANDPGCQALMKKLNTRHIEDLQGYFMGRMAKILEAKGKKLIGWDEILEGGVPASAAVMSWRGIKGGIEAAQAGHDVVMTPTTFAYIDYTQGDPTIEPPIYANLRARKCYSYEPVPDGVDAKRILGGQGNLWTEQIPTMRHAEYMTYPRAWALSEVFWSPKEAKNWPNFVQRMENHFGRADAAGINYATAIYDPIIRTTGPASRPMLDLEAEIPGLDIHYSFDDTMPDNQSARYTAPVPIPDGPITLRVVTYRGGKPMGHLITLKREDLLKRR